MQHDWSQGSGRLEQEDEGFTSSELGRHMLVRNEPRKEKALSSGSSYF